MDYEFPTKLTGYHYLKEGITFILGTNTIPTNKILFSHLADKFNTDPDNIDRCLRTLVDKQWSVLVNEGLFNQRPTNREFVLKCAEHVIHGNLSGSYRSVYDILSRPF